jgi:large subunit ribosomal protein L15
MKYNELVISRNKDKTRVGRGIAAGKGKTAGRGTKGQGARKSGGVRPGFEGGQIPLYMRLPKLRGFKSHKTKPEIVYTGQLELIKKAVVDSVALAEAGLISSPYVSSKLIIKGDVNTKKTVKIQAASAKAIEAVQKAGGTFEKVERLARPAKKIAKKDN